VFHRYQLIANYVIMGWGSVDSVVERISLAQSIAMEAFRVRPITGWGIDCFRFLKGAEERIRTATITELLVSGGVPMLILYYGALLTAVALAITCALAHEGEARRAKKPSAAMVGAMITLVLRAGDDGREHGVVL
jgi:O-antigen ligase